MDIIVLSCHGALCSDRPEKEQEYVKELFARGLSTFHLRKPTYSIDEMRQWLDKIDRGYHNRIVVHSFHDLALEYDLKGIHVTTRQRTKCAQSQRQVNYLLEKRKDLQLSTSFHKLDELLFAPKHYRYVFLSPVYDSISKEHYTCAFPDRGALREAVTQARNSVYALGGVEASRLKEIRQLGFDGAAVLGAVWKSKDPVAAYEEIQQECELQTSALSA